MFRRILISFFDLYQKGVSPLLGSRCRFFPSCSSYGKEAVEKKGPVKGLFLTAARLLRCHPFHPGGYDPVKP